MVVPPKWMVYFMENPTKYRWFRGTPILGNHRFEMVILQYDSPYRDIEKIPSPHKKKSILRYQVPPTRAWFIV